ncbi:Tyrosine--trna ligase, partial [Thalictrum thalictroides]
MAEQPLTASLESQIPTQELETLSVDSQVQTEEGASSSSNSISSNTLTLEQRYEIIRSIGEECIQEDELMNLLEKKPQPICYDGFEPSGRMHIAQ